MASPATAPTPIRLTPADAGRFVRLRARMLRDAPWAFGASEDDDHALDRDQVAGLLSGERNAIVAIEAEPSPHAAAELVAAAGIVRSGGKHAHRASVWGVFVEGAYRGAGYGRVVLTAALDVARGWDGVDWVDLGVSEGSPGARCLYESLGFEAWGREPEATEWAGRRYDEIHMTLRLRPPGGPPGGTSPA